METPDEPRQALGHLHQVLVKTKFTVHDAMEDVAALGGILDAANISARLLSKEAQSFKSVIDQYLPQRATLLDSLKDTLCKGSTISPLAWQQKLLGQVFLTTTFKQSGNEIKK